MTYSTINCYEYNKFVVLSALAVLMIGATIAENSDEAYGGTDRNTGDRNVGQQNCTDAEAINPNNDGASEKENDRNFVGGDLNIR
jgi:hypothetical protein